MWDIAHESLVADLHGTLHQEVVSNEADSQGAHALLQEGESGRGHPRAGRVGFSLANRSVF